jgi:ribosomal protein S18 acetylase RimI-like enzyme
MSKPEAPLPDGVAIRRLVPADLDAVLAASPLFNGPADRAATERFLAAPDHHLFMAFDRDVAVGFVSGVETTHPDKGTEMFLYELAVDASARGAAEPTHHVMLDWTFPSEG